MRPSGTINPGLVKKPFIDEIYNAWVGNSSLSLAWYIEAASLTLSLGGRYQVLCMVHDKKQWIFLKYSRKYDHLAGISIAAIYNFIIGKK